MTKILKLDKTYLFVALMILFAAVLNVLPIPYWTKHYWPDWMLLTTIYWCLAMPLKFNIKFAWSVGIFADLLHGSLIGHQALLYTIAAYLASSFHQLIRFYPPHQQIIPIILILFVCEVITLWINGLRYSFENVQFLDLFSAITGGLIWPWVFSVLRGLRQKLYPTAHG